VSFPSHAKASDIEGNRRFEEGTGLQGELKSQGEGLWPYVGSDNTFGC